MKCSECAYFSARGIYTKGKFIQNETNGNKTGWCQYGPPLEGEDNWPVVREVEGCGKFVRKTADIWYLRAYKEQLANCEELRKKLVKFTSTHKAVGTIAPLVGLRSSASRVSIIAAIKKALESE